MDKIKLLDRRFKKMIPAEEIVPENFNSAQALYELVTRLADE